MLNRLILLASLISVIVLMIMLNLTTPAGIGPLGVLIFFILVYLVMLGVMTGLLTLFYRLTGRKGLLRRKDYAYAAVVAFAPIMLLLVQSFGAVSLWTICLIAAFVGLGCFLVSKRV